MFVNSTKKFGSQRAVIRHLNSKAFFNGFKIKYSYSNFNNWRDGKISGSFRFEYWAPLWICLEICKSCGIPLTIFQNNVLAYKDSEQGTPIHMPNLPVIVSPEFDSILAHLLGDGCFGGYSRSASYTQKNEIARKNFYVKLTNVFGKFYLNRFEYNCYWKVLIPSSIVKIIKKYYGIGDNASGMTISFPKKILNKNGTFGLACLISFLVDEGHIGTSIEIYSSNRSLLVDISKFLDKLDYTHSPVKLKAKKGVRTHKFNHYRILISLTSAKKLLNDINSIHSFYPSCNLAHKNKNLIFIVNRQAIKEKRKVIVGVTKQKILRLLNLRPRDTKELLNDLNISGSGLMEHLHRLEKDGKIERTPSCTLATSWAVKNQ